MNPRRGLLFDLDGTLVDSIPDLSHALNRMLARLGRRAVTESEVRGWVGEGAAVLVERTLAGTGPVVGLDAAVEDFLGLYAEDPASRTLCYPGVVAMLESLRAPMAVVTNKPHRHTVAVLESLNLLRFFPVVLGADSTARRKPDPLPLLAAMARLGVDEALMIGDSAIDIAAARAAGLPVLAVSWGYGRGVRELVDARCWVESPEDMGSGILIPYIAGIMALRP